MKFRFLYLVFIWLTTAIVGSILYFFVALIDKPSVLLFGDDFIALILLMIGFTLLFSIPAMIVFGTVVYFLSRTILSIINKKHFLTVVAVGLCSLSYGAIGFDISGLILILPSFIVPLVGSIYYFKLNA